MSVAEIIQEIPRSFIPLEGTSLSGVQDFGTGAGTRDVQEVRPTRDPNAAPADSFGGKERPPRQPAVRVSERLNRPQFLVPKLYSVNVLIRAKFYFAQPFRAEAVGRLEIGPTGRNKLAQGNALGFRVPRRISPEEPRDKACARAIVSPLQGLRFLFVETQGVALG